MEELGLANVSSLSISQEAHNIALLAPSSHGKVDIATESMMQVEHGWAESQKSA